VAIDDTRMAAAAANLRVDSVTAEVVSALRDGGVRSILLKGPAVARWLYDEPGERPYGDTDLLVAPEDLRTAEQTLSGLGFEPGGTGWLGRSRAWRRAGREVDLHTSLFGVEAPGDQVWVALSSGTVATQVAGTEVEVLREEARTLHVATHAAQHLPFPQTHRDLERALTRLPRATWEGAARLATELGAEPAFTVGLGRAEGGAAVVRELGLTPRVSAEVALLDGGDPPPTALGFAHLAAAGSLRMRLTVLRRALVPPRASMRRASPLARRGELGLALAYVSRMARLGWSSPAGLVAWRRARRAT
jgi:Uncharacterised nucleotidyltransferase